MIELQKPNEWQKFDVETGLLFPWLVESFLDELKTWDLKNKKIFEFGLGNSTLYWSRKCRKVYGVENNIDYFDVVNNWFDENGDDGNVRLTHKNDKESYINSVYFYSPYDIIIVDGDPVEWRDDCIKAALKCLNKGGKLIVDNWCQEEVYVPSNEIMQLVGSYPLQMYWQEGYDSWKTAVFHIS